MPYSAISELPDQIRELPAQRQRQWMAVWNSSYAACMKDEFSKASDCESEAFAKANGVIKGAEMGDQAWAVEQPFFVFMDAAKAFHAADFSQPMWIPFLPKPGKYQHPRYGEINVTSESNQMMVDSVKNNVYQENIPMDAEHETKLSGAVGWIKDMRLNEDGSADAFIEWTDRGVQLLAGGRFKYVSPEWFDAWRDPATSTVHRNVVAGGAITTRPFFKEKVLRALVASEDGDQILIDKEAFAEMKTCASCGKEFQGEGTMCAACADKKMTEDKNVPDPKDQPTLTLSEVETKIKEATEAVTAQFTEKISELTTKVEAAETLAASEKTAREAATTELASMKSADRKRRFSDLVAGRGGSNDGAPWAGDAEKNVAILEKMAETFGEDSDDFKAYIENQNAIAEQLKTALFTEHGTAARGGAQSDPERRLEELTKARMASDTTLTHAKAYAEVLASEEGQKLYSQIA